MRKKLFITTLLAIIFISSSYAYADVADNIDKNINKTIINKDEIQNQNSEDIKNIFDTSSGIETDGESLIIRGVGEDGRGISVTDDGVSLTDVSGAFSIDIDTSELEKLIVYKGPGSIYSVNGTGGVLKAKSRSVFKMDNNLKATLGNYGYQYFKLNAHNYFNTDRVVNFTYTNKTADNDYKEHSAQENNRFSLRFGQILDDTSSIEASIKYNDNYKDRIQPVTDAGFIDFKNDITISNDGLWVFNSKDLQTSTVDSRYKKYFGNDLLKLNVFYSEKQQTHYNDGKINVNNDNYNTGVDIEYEFKRDSHTLLLGSSYKRDEMLDNHQYKYADITTTTINPSTERVDAVNGTALGDELSVSNSNNYLLGIYASDEYKINNKLKLESSLRIDSVNFDVDSTQFWTYNGSTERYTFISGGDVQKVSQTNTLITPRLALIMGLNNTTNTYLSISQGERSINDTQLLVNIKNAFPTDINPATSTNYELGLKHSSKDIIAQVSIYHNTISDDIIEVKDPSISLKYYENAGEIDKNGLELGLKYTFKNFYYIGTNYSYMDYQYVSYIASGGDFSGNTLHSIPDYKYAIYTGFKNPVIKMSAKLEIITSGSYYSDDANTHKYEGYSGVTNLILGREFSSNHKLMFNMNNIFDKRYATDATYSSNTDLTTYTVAEPRTIKLSYLYKF